MRIVEPQSFNTEKSLSKKKHRTRIGKKYFVILTCLCVVVISVFYITKKPGSVSSSLTAVEAGTDPIKSPAEVPENVESAKSGSRNFSGNEFRLLYDNLVLPNTEKVGTPPTISGNDVADARIRQLAEARGYKLRSSPLTTLPLIDGYPLQSSAHSPWKDLQQAAAQAGLQMSVVSAFRSVDAQRELFMSRLLAEGVSITDVAAGLADEEINNVLVTSSIPGYSKHHSGYTIDILCAGWEFENFKNSPCNDWLMENNYEQAKIYGFIPSYPLDADLQGPDPEAWEYVYVGVELLNY